MKTLVACAMGGALLLLAACDTTSPVASYTAYTPNVLAFQNAMKTKGVTVKVGDFTLAGGVEKPGCRMVGGLDVTAGKPLEAYVKDAFQTELFTAQVYDVNSPLTITGQLDEVKVNTFGTGSWSLGLKVTSNRYPEGYHVHVVRNFSTSYVATAACQNATNAFAPTVQALIGEVVADPNFGKLVGRS
jgi:hypothetical protein